MLAATAAATGGDSDSDANSDSDSKGFEGEGGREKGQRGLRLRSDSQRERADDEVMS